MADAARLPNAPVRPKTLAEYLTWEEAQADKHEFRAGQITMMTGGTLRHTTIAGNVFAALRTKLGKGPCRPYLMNARVALEEAEAGYYPDIVVDCGAYVGSALATAQPTVVFEVLSLTTRNKDFSEKVPDYRDTASMRQIVLVEPDERSLHVWTRRETGWRQSQLGPTSAMLELPSLGIALTLDDIYEGA
jgi:Uma2 family endonuclease